MWRIPPETTKKNNDFFSFSYRDSEGFHFCYKPGLGYVLGYIKVDSYWYNGEFLQFCFLFVFFAVIVLSKSEFFVERKKILHTSQKHVCIMLTPLNPTFI